jgi:carbamoyl-phosphate synthase large subunit
MKLTIAVTGLNSGENPQPGPGVIRSLRRRFRDLRIVGLAYGTLESAIYVENSADVVYQIPYPSAGIDALMERLDYIHARESIDILIPTLDAEIQPLILAQDPLKDRGIKTLLPTLGSFQDRSKERLHEMLEGTGTSVPRSVSVFSAGDLTKAAAGMRYPIMVKGPYYDAYKVFCQSELVAAFHKVMGEWGGPVIVQEFVSGEEFNIAALGDGKGGIDASCTIRKSVRSEKGKGYGGIVVDDPELTMLGQKIISKLKWEGPCELEFIQDAKDETYYLLEINPRFPAWIDFPSTFGYNLPKLLVDRLMDIESPAIPAQCPTGYFFLRHATDISGRIEDLGQLTTFGEINRTVEGLNSGEMEAQSFQNQNLPSRVASEEMKSGAL